MEKEILTAAIDTRNWSLIENMAKRRGRLLSKLFAKTISTDSTQSWRAIEAIGVASKIKAKADLEKIRDFIRRCIWMMNDESGGLGWHSPEIMGEILYQVPTLIPEFGHLLFHYFNESPFERGAVHAVMRIASLAPSLVESHLDQMLRMIQHEDATIRLLSFIALKQAGITIPKQLENSLSSDSSKVCLYSYSSGEMCTGHLNHFLSHESNETVLRHPITL